MIISLSLIAAVALFDVNPLVLLLLLFTWIPDIVLCAMFYDLFKE